jgi:putative transposase
MRRKVPFQNNQIHHIFSKSISHFQIFNSPADYDRFFHLMRYYKYENLPPFSNVFSDKSGNDLLEKILRQTNKNDARISILAYCLMPTHFHMIVRQEKDSGIEFFARNVCNGYSHYFNRKYNRKGPLWQNRFGNTLVGICDLLETTRYLHLNPTTAYLTDHPSFWKYSSFHEYTKNQHELPSICSMNDTIFMSTKAYEHFVVSFIEEQRAKKAKNTN